MRRVALSLLLIPASAQVNWRHLSSRHGDLPVPNGGRQQTATLVADLNKDGRADFIITERTRAPSVIWYRRTPAGWTKHVLDDSPLRIEAGGAAGDLDGDGDLDVVFGGDGASSELWWWENPYPLFHPSEPWTRRIIKRGGANKHHDQLLADFDGDRRADLVFWNQGARKLYFAPVPRDSRNTSPWPLHEIFSWEGVECEGLDAADIDGDRKLDIVGCGRWFKHLGGTKFEERVIDDAQRFTRAAAGQIKKGGQAEVVFVAGDGKGRLKWYEWSNEKWVPHDLLDVEIVHAHSLRIADIDRDGNLDIFAGEMAKWTNTASAPDHPHARMRIFYGDGKGNFRVSQVAAGFGVHEARLADLDGDKDLDILAKPYNWDTPRLDIWLNEGRAGRGRQKLALDRWQRHVIDDSKPWRAVFIDAIDLDGDGRRDVVAGGWWYRNPGSGAGAWSREVIGPPFHNFAAIADFDNDGDWDLLGTQGKGSEANSNLAWARNDGRGRFTVLVNIPSGDGDFLQGAEASGFQAGPLGVALSWHKAGMGVQLVAPSPAARAATEPWTWRKISTESQDEQVSAGDIDRDGDTDLLLGTRWLRNDRTSWIPFLIHPTPGDPDRNRLADINNDGRADAVVAFEAINKPGKVAWYEQPTVATELWREHVVALDIVGPMSLDVADVDRDGDLDMVVGEHNYEKPETAVLWIVENLDGRGLKWARHRVHTGDEHHDGAKLVDIDDDGDLDIVSLGWSHARILLYENKAVDRKRATR